jgi:hypothetical protein
MFPRINVLGGTAIVLATLAVSATAATVPLRPGDYVQLGLPCIDAPSAARLTYDGRSFTGAHSSNCLTTITSRRGPRYILRSNCRSAGDGSPTPPYAETQTVTVRWMSRFTFVHRAGAGVLDQAEYRLCAKAGSPG